MKSQFCLSLIEHLISCEWVATGTRKSQFYHSFWRSNFISCERVAAGTRKSQFYRCFCDRTPFRARFAGQLSTRNFTAVFSDGTSFRVKGFAGQLATRNFTSVLCDQTSFRAKGFCTGRFATRSFRTSFRAKGLRPDNFTSVFGDRTSFRAKGLRQEAGHCNFTTVFGDRTSFRAKRLRFVPSRWHCPAPSREK